MNAKPLFIASLLIVLLTACGLEGGGLALVHALVILVLTTPLLIWSFMQTDWWEGGERK